mgnify:CR=1 FL=1
MVPRKYTTQDKKGMHLYWRDLDRNIPWRDIPHEDYIKNMNSYMQTRLAVMAGLSEELIAQGIDARQLRTEKQGILLEDLFLPEHRLTMPHGVRISNDWLTIFVDSHADYPRAGIHTTKSIPTDAIVNLFANTRPDIVEDWTAQHYV